MEDSLTLIAAILVIAFLCNWVKDVKPPEDFWQ